MGAKLAKEIDDLWIEKYPYPPLPSQTKDFGDFIMLKSVVVSPLPYKVRDPKKVGFLNVYSKLYENVDFCNEMYEEISIPGCILAYWIPLDNINRFSPSRINWPSIGSILSSNEIGFIFRNPFNAETATPKFGCKKFFNQPSVLKSSAINKYLVESFMLSTPEYIALRGIVFDTYTNDDAHLPLWCKRLGVAYAGFSDEKNIREINNKLAQQQLPMIQGSLF